MQACFGEPVIKYNPHLLEDNSQMLHDLLVGNLHKDLLTIRLRKPQMLVTIVFYDLYSDFPNILSLVAVLGKNHFLTQLLRVSCCN